MAHQRHRHILNILQKKLKYSPVTAIQGARQTGKSFLVREILAALVPDLVYVTFDQDSAREFASRDVESFLAKYADAHPLVIDEPQKVPKVFDAVKFEVDRERRPGRFVLLGSTEFSKMTLVRESLTGRLTRCRLFPLTMSETCQLETVPKRHPFFLSPKPRVSRQALLRHLDHGGLASIFAVRSGSERNQALQDWIELTIYRDAQQIPKIKVDSDLCRRILIQIAQNVEPTAGKIAQQLRVDLRRIKTHLSVLETLFVVTPIAPHPAGSGKSLYYLVDVGVAQFLGAPLLRQLETLFLQEYLAKSALSEESVHSQIYYYRSGHGARISFVEETKEWVAGVQIFPDPGLNKRNFYALSHFVNAMKSKALDVRAIALVPNTNVPNPSGVECLTWEVMA